MFGYKCVTMRFNNSSGILQWSTQKIFIDFDINNIKGSWDILVCTYVITIET